MTPTEKLNKIKELLPEKPSSIFHDCEYCRLVSEISSIIEDEFDFWKAAADAHETVSQWPEWKRNIKLTKYS